MVIARFEEVRVDVERCRSVSEATRDGANRYAGGEELRGVHVAKVVESHVVETSNAIVSTSSASLRFAWLLVSFSR